MLPPAATGRWGAAPTTIATARLVTVCLLLAMMLFGATLTAGGADAHASRVSADPAENAILSTSPTLVSATFNEPLQTRFAAMTVVGPDGNLWSSGQPQVQGALVSVGVRPLGPTGTYTVNYRVTSADGHVVSGSWSFRLTAPGTGTPGPPAENSDSGSRGIPVWPFFVAAVALVGGAALWAMRRRG
jgi:copper resistance protein C